MDLKKGHYVRLVYAVLPYKIRKHRAIQTC